MNRQQEENTTFDPQTIGRLFVRQYYTMLNEGPQYLHRFYCDESAMLHAGSVNEPPSPVYGVDNIQNKIVSLNFQNCRTKITNIDILETVSDGVVIQVVGGLSNNSQPMRRFLQTFILVPRTQTNYYVRTDIFRYQDLEEEEDSEAERDVEASKEPVEAPNEFPNNSQFSETSNTIEIHPEVATYENISINGEVNNVGEVDRPIEEAVESTRAILEKTKIGSPVNNNIDEGYNEGEDRLVNDSSGSHGSEEQSFEPCHETNSQDEPKTYANMVSRNPPGNTTHSPPFNHSTNFTAKPSDGANNVMPSNGAFKNKSWSSSDKSTENTVSSGTNVITPTSAISHPQANTITSSGKQSNVHNKGRPRASGLADQPRKGRHENRDITPLWSENDSSHSDNAGGDYSGRRQQFSDEQQVFVGNLLQDITEDQLRSFFSKYGNIIDVRINRTNQKQGRTPNYGFVTFDDPAIVKKILAQKPIYFDDHRFNVEEKRSQTNRGSGNNSNRTGVSGMQGPNQGRTLNSSSSSSRQSDRDRDRIRRDRDRDRNYNRHDRNERGERNERTRKKDH